MIPKAGNDDHRGAHDVRERRRVLACDHNAAAAESVRRVLERFGYAVTVAGPEPAGGAPEHRPPRPLTSRSG